MSELYYDNIEEHIDGEEWKQHPTYKNYEGSNFGRIRNIKTKRIRKQRLHCGYLQLGIMHCGKKVAISSHRFILSCFDKQHTAWFCDHVDSNPMNNRIENLRWCRTHKENCNNPNTRKKCVIPKKNMGSGGLKLNCYDKNHTLIKTFDTLEEAKKFCNVVCNGSSSIGAALRGRINMAYGYFWEYNIELFENEIIKNHPELNIGVSNMGRVFRKDICGKYKKIAHASKSTSGYLKVNIRNEIGKKTYYVHRLVAETFLSNTENKPYVNHKNTNRLDNRLENLEWCTPEENMRSEETHKKIKQNKKS